MMGTDYPFDMPEFNPVGHIAGVHGMNEVMLAQIAEAMPRECSALISELMTAQGRAPDPLNPGCSNGCEVANAGISKQRSARRDTIGNAPSSNLIKCALTT
jgi:hypothetical protein